MMNNFDGSIIAVVFWGITCILFFGGAVICLVNGAFGKALAFIAGIGAWSYLSIFAYIAITLTCAHNCQRGPKEQAADTLFSLGYAAISMLVIWYAFHILNNLEAQVDPASSTDSSSDDKTDAP